MKKKSFKIADLTKVLSLFNKINKVPGIGDIKKTAEKIVATVMKPTQEVVNTIFKEVGIPTLTFLPNFGVNVPKIPVDLAEEIRSISSKIPRIELEVANGCANAGLK